MGNLHLYLNKIQCLLVWVCKILIVWRKQMDQVLLKISRVIYKISHKVLHLWIYLHKHNKRIQTREKVQHNLNTHNLNKMWWVKSVILILLVDLWELEVVLNSNLFIRLVQGLTICLKQVNLPQTVQTR